MLWARFFLVFCQKMGQGGGHLFTKIDINIYSVIVTKFSTEQILEGIVSNDTHVLEHIYRSFFPKTLVYVRSNGGTREDAYDVFQESVVIVLQRVRKEPLVLNCSFETYLISIVKILFYHMRLSAKKRNAVLLDYEKLTEEIEEIDGEFLETYRQNQMSNIIQRHFIDLSEGCQTLLRLYIERVSIREIADMMGVSEGFVKKKKYACKQKLIKRVMADFGSKEFFYE